MIDSKRVLHIFFGLIIFMLSYPIDAASGFHKHPLEGTWELFESNPPTKNFPTEGLGQNVLFEGQRFKLKFMGAWGSDWPGRDEYTMTLLPPYDPRMCDHPKWDYLCESERYGFRRIPANPEDRDVWINIEKIGAPDKKYGPTFPQFVPYGLKQGQIIFGMTFADKSGTYLFYFIDKDTIVSSSAYFYPDNSKESVARIMQKFRRIKTPIQ